MQHQLVGELTLQYETFTLPDDPDQMLVTYSAVPGSESDQALRLLASWTSPAPDPAAREKSRFAQRAPELP
jgi:hypothetical protein